MPHLADREVAIAALDEIITLASTRKAALAELDIADVYTEALNKAVTEMRPPLFDRTLTAVGQVQSYRGQIDGLLGLLAQLVQQEKIAPLDPALVSAFEINADGCDASKQPFSNLGQAMRDLTSIPGLLDAVMEAMGGEDGEGG